MGKHRAVSHRPARVSLAPVRTIAAVTVVAGLLTGQALAAQVEDAITPTHDVRPVVIDDHAQPLTENDPGWDCRTMGNRICGPVNG